MHRLLSFCFHFRFFTYKPFAIQEATSVKAGKFPANIYTKTHIKPGNRSLYAGQTVTFRRTKPSLLRGKAFISPGVTIDSPSTKALFPFSVSICSLRSKHFELTKETLFQINTGRNYRKQKTIFIFASKHWSRQAKSQLPDWNGCVFSEAACHCPEITPLPPIRNTVLTKWSKR